MWQDLWVALSLVLVIEGLMPFLSPRSMRETLRMMSELDDRTLRIIGLASMVLGVIMLYLVR